MKKILSLIIVAVAIFAMPTKSEAQLRYAAIAGPTFSNLNFKQNLIGVDQSTGFTLGVQGEVIFPGIGLGIDLGLIYNQLGAKVNLGEKTIWSSMGYGNEHVQLHYAQIPLHLRWKWTRLGGIEEKIAPFIYAGPDMMILMGHGNCSAFKCAGAEISMSVGAGLEIMQKWQISWNYTWGMTYALKTQLLDDFSARNRHWSVRLAYFFK